MFNTKAINPDFLSRKETLRDKIVNFCRPIMRILEKIKRSYDWAAVGWNNHDWDYSYLLEIMVFKMKRMQKACFEEGHHIPEKLPEQSLRLCIKLGEKLRKDDYHYHSSLHAKKWGEIDFVEKMDDVGNKYTTLGRALVTFETEEQERAEAIEAYRKDDSIKNRDSRWFYSIMQKYQESWWD